MKKLLQAVIAVMALSGPCSSGEVCVAFDASTRQGKWVIYPPEGLDCSIFSPGLETVIVEKSSDSLNGFSALVKDFTLDADGKTIHVPVDETEVKKVVRDIP